MTKRIVFMGSPDFALPTLQALADHYRVAGVVTQPDRPAGRGRRLTPPAVKSLAEALGLRVIQPKSLKDQTALATIEGWRPDLIVVTAFGQILRAEVLELPPFGSLNVHASLLPRWRGAAPIQAAIMHGDQYSGVTIMKMDEGIDTGPLLSQRKVPLAPNETAGSLSERLAQLGADLLIETLPEYFSGELQPHHQQGEHTYARMLKKHDGELDFSQNAEALERKIRAFDPWPGTFMNWQNKQLKILKAKAAAIYRTVDGSEGQPGQRTVHKEHPAVFTGEGLLVLIEIQPAGKKAMEGSMFLRGARNWSEGIDG
ncbi:MAG: methionyl-tRNA formyltransferase [Chloroflexota bacterium]|nr:MAG: methionyl-tRNA formyltransferase [Chloroflexota bacterium]